MKEFARYVQIITGIQLSNQQLAAFEVYERELMDWNTRVNLTAIDNPEQIRIKHFLDSLTCLCAMHDTPIERIIDVGSGAGFPGLPIKIVYPQMQLTLVESVGKKTKFLNHLVSKLGLDRVEILQERAEAIGQQPAYREKFDWALARAVAIMPVLAEYLLPLVRVGGAMLAMKGESGPAEAHSAERAFQILGGHLRKLIPVTLPGVVDERFLVVVDKVAAIHKDYPRRVGLPAKKPLK